MRIIDVAKREEKLIYREIYPLREPYAYAAIVEDPETHEIRYLVMEPKLTDSEKEIYERLVKILLEELKYPPKSLGSDELAEKYLREEAERVVKKYRIKVSPSSFDKIFYYLCRDMLYYGKIDPFMRDPYIEDISCDGPGRPIYVWHRKYESIPTNVRYETPQELDSFVVRLAYICGRHISIAQPMVDASLPDGSRINITYSTEVTKGGSTFTIRKFRADPITIIDILNFGTISVDVATYFWFLVEHKKSLMIAGATASGKTTMLNAISTFIKPGLKIVTIEDTPELNLPHENWIQSVARVGFGGRRDITLFDLLEAAMRQRPDYVIVGEIRGAEAYTLFQALATGHGGLCTIHADSISGIIHRLTTDPMNIPKQLIPAMNVMMVQIRTTKGRKPIRRTKIISEIVDYDKRTGELMTNVVFRWDPRTDSFAYTGRSYIVERIRREEGYTRSFIEEEFERRKIILKWMQKDKIRSYKEVARVIKAYYLTPEEIYQKAAKSLGVAA